MSGVFLIKGKQKEVKTTHFKSVKKALQSQPKKMFQCSEDFEKLKKGVKNKSSKISFNVPYKEAYKLKKKG